MTTPVDANQIDWGQIWTAVAAELRKYREVGLHRLLTEDVVRFATVRALVDHGLPPPDLRVEWAAPGPRRGHIDLVVGDPPTTAVEFKYPREPVEKDAAWTQTLGETMEDFYRLASLPPSVATRRFVLVSTARLRSYLAGVADRHGVNLLAHRVEFSPSRVAGLPSTALSKIAPWAVTDFVVARAQTTIDIDDDLRFAAYDVQPAG